MHLLYGLVRPKILQWLTVHEKFENNEVYTIVFGLNVMASQQLRFILYTH